MESSGTREATTVTELTRQFEDAVRVTVSDPLEQLRIEDALRFAIRAHTPEEPRSASEPEPDRYPAHPLKVALTVVTEFECVKPDIIVAALLHDVVEDESARVLEIGPGGHRSPETPISHSLGMDLPDEQRRALGVIAERFGDRVAQLVAALTNPPSLNTPDMTKKAQAYHEHVTALFAGDPDVAIIKMADFSQNAFRLKELDDAERRSRLRAKYCPVIDFLNGYLTSLDDDSHPLHAHRSMILDRLALARDDECTK